MVTRREWLDWGSRGARSALRGRTSRSSAASAATRKRRSPRREDAPKKRDAKALDLVGWGVPQLFEGTPITLLHAAEESLERKANISSTRSTMAAGGPDEMAGNGFDSGDNSNDFLVRFVAQPQNAASPAEPVVERIPALSAPILALAAAGLTLLGGYAARRGSLAAPGR